MLLLKQRRIHMKKLITLIIFLMASVGYATSIERDVYHCVDFDGGAKFTLAIYTNMDGEQRGELLSGRKRTAINLADIELVADRNGNYRLTFLKPASDEQVFI